MAPATTTGLELQPLDWDTRQFGFSVARLRAPGDPTERIAATIADARQLGVEMLVVMVGREQRLPDALLAEFRGALVDEKATFARELDTTCPADAKTSIAVESFAGESAPRELVALSIASGELSRFRVDPRFPRAKFEELYTIWIERSVRRELADDVLVARESGDPSTRILGMVTVAVDQGVGSIGLIAVDRAARGRGVGSRLIEAAHASMTQRGATSARVVTQAANRPACGLYERAGYRWGSVERVYHFWPRIAR